VEGFCEHGNELSGSVNIETFLSSCTTSGFSTRAEMNLFIYMLYCYLWAWNLASDHKGRTQTEGV
jgi:hypothetical protein